MADPVQYLCTVSNHTTGQRFSYPGPKKACEEAAALKVKEWKGCEVEVSIVKRMH
jgi:hypothetical protein